MAGQPDKPIRRRPAVAGERARRRRELATPPVTETEVVPADAASPSAEPPGSVPGAWMVAEEPSYDESADLPTEDRPPAAPASPRLRLVSIGLLVLAVLVVVGALLWRHHASTVADSRQAGRVAAVAEAKRAAVDLLSVNHTKLAENKAKALAHLAPKFKAEYDRFFTDLESTAKKNQLVLSADVVGAGTVRMPDEDHVVVLLFVDQVSTNAVRATPRIDQNRVRMRLVRSGDRWLVEGLDAI